MYVTIMIWYAYSPQYAKGIQMVNGLHLYSAFIQSAVQIDASHSPIQTPIHTPTAIGCHARYQPASSGAIGG